MTMTRRNFIQSLGAVAGVEAVYRTMQARGLSGVGKAQAAALDLPPGSGRDKSVVILGAGISGMTAARSLS